MVGRVRGSAGACIGGWLAFGDFVWFGVWVLDRRTKYRLADRLAHWSSIRS